MNKVLLQQTLDTLEYATAWREGGRGKAQALYVAILAAIAQPEQPAAALYPPAAEDAVALVKSLGYVYKQNSAGRLQWAQPEHPAAPVAPIPALPVIDVVLLSGKVASCRERLGHGLPDGRHAFFAQPVTPPVAQAEPTEGMSQPVIAAWLDKRGFLTPQDVISPYCYQGKEEWQKGYYIPLYTHHSKDADSPDAGQAEGGAA